MVKVTLVPSAGVELLTVFVMAISAACPVTVAMAELLPATGSGSVSAVLVAVFVTAAVPLTVATIDSVAFAPLATAPMFQMPVPELYVVPALGTEDTYVRPAGSRSVTCTPVALLGPLLVAVMVNVTLVPWFGRVLSTSFVMARSAATGVTVALAESFPESGSGWTSAVLVAVFVAGAVGVPE